ncbi:hypothetical protein [Amycolatopsis vastitatis]|uniref:Uncharacterized protein n=1 Tax=Amycolatopsis vastitatis TaxID=1905142 RepID=A0A229T4F2_9PSEU|nr:hypothetical protein [Amycolatopsis vastitatis]OXM65814.1 hypothetical protein CF165_20655 [Amycolatopsis vastitatis]
MTADPRWEPVETFEPAGRTPGPVDLADAAARAAGIGARRLRSRSGERAILVPAESLATAGVSPAVRHVLFIDPVGSEVVAGLLDAVGEPAAAVRVAVPEGAAPAGLTADTGRVEVGVSFPLHRIDGTARPRIAPGPRVGESPDVTAARAKWFGTRH